MVSSSDGTIFSSDIFDLVIVLFLLSPESQVLLEQFDDALGIAEVVLLELVDLVESLLQGQVRKLARLRVVLHHLVVEDREVEGEAELDGVAGREVDYVRLLVALEGFAFHRLEQVTLGVLCNVAVVVSHHLHEEGLRLVIGSVIQHLLLDDIDDPLTVVSKLLLDGGLVVQKGLVELGVLRVLLDGRDRAAGSALAGDEVLEGDGEEVALVGVDFTVLLVEDLGEEIDHVLEALSLLGDTGQERVLFNGGSHL